MTEKASEILQSLEDWRKKDGELPVSLELYRKLLCIQLEAESRIHIRVDDFDKTDINEKLSRGCPLLGFDDICIDWQLLQGIIKQVATIFTQSTDVSLELPEFLKYPDPSLDFLKKASREWFEEGQRSSEQGSCKINTDMTGIMLHIALKPFLTRHSEALIGLVDQEKWRRGYCPICGGNPDFAFLDKEFGARWLLCSRCDARWLFQRLECPGCGTQNQNTLAYFTDDEGLYRLYVCERCKCYLKAIDLRHTEHEVLLPLERLLTIDLDEQANKNGYITCTEAVHRT